MFPTGFPHPNYIPHQYQWRPQGPRFGLVRPMQYQNNQNRCNYPNNNEDHWCETCDRGFGTLELLINHRQQHQKCNIDGCQFIAHPKVITKHIQMQHSTGLYKKICKLDNPEEVQKWREERKKRYPTKENIEKRNAEIKEKIDRGEKMGMRRHKDNFNRKEQGTKRKWNQDNNRKNFNKRYQANKSNTEVDTKANDDKEPNKFIDNKKITKYQKENKIIPQLDDSKSLKPFAGILNLINDINNDDIEDDLEINDSIEDDEYIVMDGFEDKKHSNNSEPVVCEALSSLICNYESSDEEISDKSMLLQQNNKLSNLKIKNAIAIEQNVDAEPNKSSDTNIKIQIDLAKSDDDSGPEEAKIVKANTISNTDIQVSHNEDSCQLKPFKKAERCQRIKETNRNNHTKNNHKKFISKLPSTLLQKLLRNEIRQERNIVLQCIRYIIKNNYFETGSTSNNQNKVDVGYND